MRRNRFIEDDPPAPAVPAAKAREYEPTEESIKVSDAPELEPEPVAPPEPEPKYRYPEWALPMQKANCLTGLMRELSPKACRKVLGELLDAQDLAGFKEALASIWEVGRMVLLVWEAMPYCPNNDLVVKLEKLLSPGGLEEPEAREEFRRLAGVMIRARKNDLGPFYREMLAEEFLG